jgi:hypothetical protein
MDVLYRMLHRIVCLPQPEGETSLTTRSRIDCGDANSDRPRAVVAVELKVD